MKSAFKLLFIVLITNLLCAACYKSQEITQEGLGDEPGSCGGLGQQCCTAGDMCEQDLLPVNFSEEVCNCRQACDLAECGVGNISGVGICSPLNFSGFLNLSVCINRDDMEPTGCIPSYAMVACPTHSSFPGMCLFDGGYDATHYCLTRCSLDLDVQCSSQSFCVVLEQEPLLPEGVCLPLESGSIMSSESIVLPKLVE